MATSDPPTPLALNRFHRLYQHGHFSDLTVKVGENLFHVHKAILVPQSGFFARECKKVSTQLIDLSDEDVKFMAEVFKFFYRQRLETEAWNDNAKDETAFVPLLLIYKAGQRFEVPKLKKKVVEDLRKLASRDWIWSTPRQDIRPASDVIVRFIQQLAGIAPDDLLGDLMLDICSFYFAALYDVPEVRSLVEADSKLSARLLQRSAKYMTNRCSFSYGCENPPPSYPPCLVGCCESMRHVTGTDRWMVEGDAAVMEASRLEAS